MLGKIARDLREIEAWGKAGLKKLDQQKLARWCGNAATAIENFLADCKTAGQKEVTNMGQAATVINGLLQQVSDLQSQLSTAQAALATAQQNSLDASDQAAIAAGEAELNSAAPSAGTGNAGGATGTAGN